MTTSFAATAAPLIGKLVFAAVFALLIVWLFIIPHSRLGEGDRRKVPAWRNVRYWAIAIAAFQMLVYLLWP